MSRIAGDHDCHIFPRHLTLHIFIPRLSKLLSIFNNIHEAVNYSLMGIYTKLPTTLIKYSALDLIAAAIKSKSDCVYEKS